MKKTSFIMIALLFAGSAFGQIIFEPVNPQFALSQSANDCNVKIENTGTISFQIAYLGLGSPGQTFPTVILADTSNNVLIAGAWYENAICYFILDSVLHPGESMEFKLISSDGTNFSVREVELFSRIGDNTTNKRAMSTGDSIVIQSCYGSGLGIPMNNIPQGMIYPNPTSDYINISYSSITEKIERIDILNQLGNMVMQVKESETINISDLPSGIYFIHIKFGSGGWVTETILKR
jgi:hypothetical protein